VGRVSVMTQRSLDQSEGDIEDNEMASATPTIAINFLRIGVSDFSYTIHRRTLAPDEVSVPGTRNLPDDCLAIRVGERKRYEVSLQPRPGFEELKIRAWIDQGLTNDVLYKALAERSRLPDLLPQIDPPGLGLIPKVAFILDRHKDAREVMEVKAYAFRAAGCFGFLCHFRLRVPNDSSMSVKERLELSLTHKNGRVNTDFYVDQSQKIEYFLQRYFVSINPLTLHDGTQLAIEPRLSTARSFTLGPRTYVFGDGREGKSQFFGLRDYGPFQTPEIGSRLAFVFGGGDREQSQDLFRALRGDTYSTFPGMEALFRTAITRQNVTGFEIPGFSHREL
jgi:hypothetical protein